jgi:hypothetical protein
VCMSADEIVQVEDTVVLREDPVTQAEAFA